MKKNLLALACTGAVLLAGCASGGASAPAETAEASGMFKPGTYTAKAAGRNGDITVNVEFSADEIVSITHESEETESIGVPAMDTLAEKITASQSLSQDVVSGATISSDAFMEAVRDAVVQAGADPESLMKEDTSEAEKTAYETEADIIVVGGGAAGMTAAITAHDLGASVILLEKSSVLGGNTVCAANGINAADSAVQLADTKYQEAKASVEGLESLQMNNEDAHENLVKVFAENSGEVIDWMSGLGVNFTVDIREDQRNSEQNYYLLQDTSDGSTAITMINKVSAELKKQGITVYYNMDAHDLVTDENGKVTGVTAASADGEEVTFSGRSVILCTGGFGQNSELLGEVNPELANAVTDEVAPTTGEGLLMAQAVGAATANLDAIQTFPHVIPGYGMILPFSLPGGFVPDALFVNNQAERFTAEGFEIPDVLLAQDKGEVYCIFDESGMNDTLSTLVKNGVISEADTAEELAGKLGIDGTALAETISTFNEDIADGTDDAFGRQENLNTFEGKLYGYRFGVGAHYFMGGILIDEDTHVLDTDGNAIEGLYAAGEVTGGFHGTFRVDGSGLGDSFTFGRIAGRTAAEAE
ncbi:MAG: flavocytochrome c [Solobacterium sp.]|nr:flavocytochrome c [Solobacterium sp.]